MQLCVSRGLAYGHLSTLQMQEVLLQYQRTRQVPFMAMDKLQLQKLCARETPPGPADNEVHDFKSMDHWDLINYATCKYDSFCAPNGILNDSSRWEVSSLPSSSSSQGGTSKQAFKLPSSTNLLDGGKGEISRYEAWRMALRAGIDLSKQKVLETSAKQLLVQIRKAMTAKDWSPISVPPQDNSPLIRLRAEGTIDGIMPLKDSYIWLRPEPQGLVGIGRLGILSSDETDLPFANRGVQYMHAVEHLMAISPGLVFCWACQTWTLLQDDPNHSQECRSATTETN